MKPQPVVVTTICSLCDQPWEAHGDKPSTEDCIRLLKVELSRRPIYRWNPGYPGYQWYQNVPLTTPLPTYTVSASDNTSSSVIQFRRPEDPPDSAVPARTG